MEQFDSRYFRGQGPLFIGDRDANGDPTGLTFVGDVESVTLEPNVSRSETTENTTGKRLTAVSMLNGVEYALTINMRSIKPEHLQLALQGANTAKASGSVTDEAHTAYLDKFTPLEHTNVSSVTVVDGGGSPTYVEGTDYKVHADEGLIEWLSGGTISDATAVDISYDYAAQHHIKTDPKNKDKYIVFSGINGADNDKQTRVEIFKARLDPSVPNLISEETVNFPMSGRVLIDTLRSSGDQLFSWKTED